MSWDMLKRFIESDVFNQNPYMSVTYLSRYADHIGIHYVLCSKLRQFSYEEIEFFLPQLCHLIISVDNESMALEEFILDLCEESVNGALLTFWLFQSYLHDLSNNPQSIAFRTCRRVYNKVQHVVFGLSGDPTRQDKIKENILPVTVLASLVLASVAVPFLPQWAGPLAIAQARKPRSIVVEPLEDSPSPMKLHRSQTISSSSLRSRRDRNSPRIASAEETLPRRQTRRPQSTHAPLIAPLDQSSPSLNTSASALTIDIKRPSRLDLLSPDANSSSSSLPLPDLRTPLNSMPSTPRSARPGDFSQRRHTQQHRQVSLSTLSLEQKSKLLRQNYFRCQTQFLRALEDISNRLVIVPKPARLSALRAELILIAQDLPAEVDIPVIAPATLVDGVPSNSRHHRIVRLSPAECTVLNSAEKVPYLLMVEVLRDDFSFNPTTSDNERLLAELIANQGANNRRRLFDTSEMARNFQIESREIPVAHETNQPSDRGIVTSSPPLASNHEGVIPTANARPIAHLPSLGNGINLLAISPATTPRASISGSSTPSLNHQRHMSLPVTPRVLEQTDLSAIATHMRTAAQMLTQLNSTSGKRPKAEVDAIRAKIIASMQVLDEESFDAKDKPAKFEDIMANANAAASMAEPEDLEDDARLGGALNTGAGVARMENDEKTSGIRRRKDKDDPSAATFGEAWVDKKERIRKASPYGWMKNWDLISVIVKTGDDLRQEAFAVQLIMVCEKIWQRANIPVWVKRMRILVTGESSGLIETITNGVSLHSLKRSLTLATIEAGQNPKGRMASLKDHFIKTFGLPETDGYKAAEDAFRRSLAAYSIISYILQLKDRHNGNVLLDNEGHIIHIDFGFMLSNSPGSMGFEAAPFKLTQDYVDVLGGPTSESFEMYKGLCKQAFQALRRGADGIIELVSIMARNSTMPCFASGGISTTNALHQRFQLQLSEEEAGKFVENDLIAKSLGSYYTRFYDSYQYRTQGIY